MDYFSGCQKSTFNLKNKFICQGNFFAYHVTGSPYSRIFFCAMYAYLKDIYKTLKRIGKIKCVSQLTILLNLHISKFHRSLHKEKIEIIKV